MVKMCTDAYMNGTRIQPFGSPRWSAKPGP